jgi:hypothetical protein
MVDVPSKPEIPSTFFVSKQIATQSINMSYLKVKIPEVRITEVHVHDRVTHL